MPLAVGETRAGRLVAVPAALVGDHAAVLKEEVRGRLQNPDRTRGLGRLEPEADGVVGETQAAAGADALTAFREGQSVPVLGQARHERRHRVQVGLHRERRRRPRIVADSLGREMGVVERVVDLEIGVDEDVVIVEERHLSRARGAVAGVGACGGERHDRGLVRFDGRVIHRTDHQIGGGLPGGDHHARRGDGEVVGVRRAGETVADFHVRGGRPVEREPHHRGLAS